MSDSGSSSPSKASSSTCSSSRPSLPDDDLALPSPPFHDLVMILEDISKRRSERNRILCKYFSLDNARGRYGLKEQKMADLYIKSLNILPGSEPAVKLKSWKEGFRDSVGDFSLVVREVVASRSLVTHPQGQTIRDVNDMLTSLSSKKDYDRVRIFKMLVRSFTPLENKWVVRMINKDLKIGMSENSVLPCYHPDAAEQFNVCSDLKKTVIDCKDHRIRVATSEVNVNQPFKPMLSKKLLNAKDVIEAMGAGEDGMFWIETKLDGERVQIHKDGENYRYWSRNSTEYTHLYGATPKEGSLTPFIHPLIHPMVESLILDGEMVEYDPATKEIIGFGTVKTAGGDHSDDRHKRRPLLFVFDVLSMNGSSIINQPLSARKEMLPSIIPKQTEGRIEIMPHKVAKTEQDIINAIDVAVMGRQEGIIVKNPKSKYVPNGRGQEWIKIKPEYMDGVFDSLDVLIVGGYYGSGSRGGNGVISSYLCAVLDNTAKSTSGKKYMSFCKFGSGFTYEQMGVFSQLLGPHWKEYKHYRENPWVDMIDNAKMRPDVIIDPEKSIVVEIKAAEIVPNSDSYAAEYTLRFPRFLCIREDKDATSCMTLSEVHRMYREFKGKLSTRHIDSSRPSSLIKAKKKQMGPRRTTQAQLLHTAVGDTSAVKMEANLFESQVFWVVRGDDMQTKAGLEVMIKRYGGKQSQSDQMENTIIIAGVNGPDLLGLKNKGHRNIVLPTWIRDCVKEMRVIPLNPKYMYFATKETERQFRQIMDEYEDSYTEPLTIDAFQEILDKMPNRSDVIKRRRTEVAQDRVSRIEIKRLNNLEEQLDSPQHDNDEDKATILQMELDSPDGAWEREDAERARRISAALTRKYYGGGDEIGPPLGMFQGVEVFIVYPPLPREYQQMMAKTESRIKDEDGLHVGRTAANTDSDHPSTFDTLSRAFDRWTVKKEESVSSWMTKLDNSPLIRRRENHGTEEMHWDYISEEKAREEELEKTLSTLSTYELCRNNLDLVLQILEFHGARVVPQEHCTIEDCQRLLRKRASDKQEGAGEDDKYDVGLPLEIVILFDPWYLDTLDQWRSATRVSALYGPNAKSFVVPRLVTSEWVKDSLESKYRLPEEKYYPMV
ncbi:DNA ligase (ATP) [Mortierella polycephala]|uniref:DNA ligase n=1 Tax=Mortierella polycephala TaxID=41804 RepID=A0A9P6Q0G1_9FUNG|nr:DNA ligase (ATP) [Mortierella polycephala]